MPPFLPALTSLRFFAALYVVVVHFGRSTFEAGPRWLGDFAYMGSSGVSFFFVLSGFILTYTYVNRPIRAGQFWWARFARIYPVYLLTLLVSIDVFRPMLQAYLADGGNLGTVIVKLVTLTQTWTLNEKAMTVTGVLNNPSWSISTEAFFYLVFPALLFVSRRVPLRWMIAAAAGLWIALVVPAWLEDVGRGPEWVFRQLVYKNPVFRLHEFILGMVAALAFLRQPSWVRNDRLAWLLTGLMFVLLAFGVRVGVPRLAMISGALAPLFAFLLMLMAGGAGPARWVTARPLVVLGEASYALYLLHMPVGLYLLRFGMERDTTPHFLATSMATIALSLATYAWWEKPSREWLRSLRKVYANGSAGTTARSVSDVPPV